MSAGGKHHPASMSMANGGGGGGAVMMPQARIITGGAPALPIPVSFRGVHPTVSKASSDSSLLLTPMLMDEDSLATTDDLALQGPSASRNIPIPSASRNIPIPSASNARGTSKGGRASSVSSSWRVAQQQQSQQHQHQQQQQPQLSQSHAGSLGGTMFCSPAAASMPHGSSMLESMSPFSMNNSFDPRHSVPHNSFSSSLSSSLSSLSSSFGGAHSMPHHGGTFFSPLSSSVGHYEPLSSSVLSSSFGGSGSYMQQTTPRAERRLMRLLNEEGDQLPCSSYLAKIQRGEITPVMRDRLVSWLEKLNNQFEYTTETFFLAVNYVDRFLSRVRVKPRHLQLIGLASFMIAAKMQEEIEVKPTLQELVFCCDHAYSASEMLRMEKTILEKLKWQVHAVSHESMFFHLHELLVQQRLVQPLKSSAASQALASFLSSPWASPLLMGTVPDVHGNSTDDVLVEAINHINHGDSVSLMDSGVGSDTMSSAGSGLGSGSSSGSSSGGLGSGGPGGGMSPLVLPPSAVVGQAADMSDTPEEGASRTRPDAMSRFAARKASLTSSTLSGGSLGGHHHGHHLSHQSMQHQQWMATVSQRRRVRYDSTSSTISFDPEHPSAGDMILDDDTASRLPPRRLGNAAPSLTRCLNMEDDDEHVGHDDNDCIDDFLEERDEGEDNLADFPPASAPKDAIARLGLSRLVSCYSNYESLAYRPSVLAAAVLVSVLRELPDQLMPPSPTTTLLSASVQEDLIGSICLYLAPKLHGGAQTLDDCCTFVDALVANLVR
ncbi:cyclin Dx [Capsaspora owczarzaki ATCC 30864]|uniref:Cyclin Dx n=1 Tax=Capsaspora owczarzaki (strain ATCC 30864) TaxID=595528 RepID=A0A0D2WI34_CAPO3|nr:cyclin Dx [Capsaspora owczarzaki ATCC 30864]KJE88538.1 cyclin Dx [Capsaspora owczarzaki ATCC 30864]|eukprot:XP_004365050.2 cyclin Dx [Capsaspora owczarzaki ATCC 30864]